MTLKEERCSQSMISKGKSSRDELGDAGKNGVLSDRGVAEFPQ